MDVFALRSTLVDGYAAFARSFTRIRADDLRHQVDSAYADGRFWPEPLIQINPRFKPGHDIAALVAGGVLHCQSASKKDPLSASKKDPPFGMSLRGVTGFSGRWLIYRMSPTCSCARLSRVTRHRIGTGSLLAPAEPLAFAVPEIQNLLMVVAAVELWAKVDAVGNAKRCPRQGDRCAQRIVHKSTTGAGPRRWACARDRVRPGS